MEHLFQTNSIIDFLTAKKEAIITEINAIAETSFLSVDEKFINNLIIKYTHTPIVVDWESNRATKDIVEENVLLDINKGEHSVYGNTKKVAVVQYVFPHNQGGSFNVFYCRGTRYFSDSMDGFVDYNFLHFKIYTNYRSVALSPEVVSEVLAKKERAIQTITRDIDSLNADLNTYNVGLFAYISEIVNNRKEKIKSKNDLLKQL
jgi:hypothetical protein